MSKVTDTLTAKMAAHLFEFSHNTQCYIGIIKLYMLQMDPSFYLILFLKLLLLLKLPLQLWPYKKVCATHGAVELSSVEYYVLLCVL